MMHNVAKGLLGKGHEVTVIAPNTVQLKPARLRREENIDGVNVRRVKAYRILPYTLPWFTPEIFSAIHDVNADVIHVFSYHPTFITNVSYFAAKIKRIPLVVSPIFNPYLSPPYLNYLAKIWANFYRKVIGLKILSLADVVTAIAESEAEYYRARGVKNVHMLPGAVRLNENKIAPEDLQNFKNKFGIGEEKIIISVGRMVRYKGHDMLIRAFDIACKFLPDTKLLIIGKDFGYRQKLEAIVRELDCQHDVIFTAGLSDEEVSCAYEVADAMVHPSLFETFGITIVEAWSHKKPVITFDKIGKLISGETVITAKYGDVKELAQAMVKLLSNEELCHTLGLKGYELVKQFYTWDKVVDDLEKVYYNLIWSRSTGS